MNFISSILLCLLFLYCDIDACPSTYDYTRFPLLVIPSFILCSTGVCQCFYSTMFYTGQDESNSSGDSDRKAKFS